MTCSNCTAVAEKDQESLSFCTSLMVVSHPVNFRHQIALPDCVPVEQETLHLPHMAVLED